VSRFPARLLFPLTLATLFMAGLATGEQGKGLPVAKVGSGTSGGVVAAGPAQSSDRGDYHGKGRSTNGAVRLLRARELRQEETAQGEVAYLVGDVKMIQDSLTIWCDEAHHKRKLKRLELFGDVVMVDPEKRLKADQVVYYEDSRRSLARGHVELTRDSVVLTSRQGQYDERNSLASFEQDMRIHDLRRDIVLTGRVGTYNTKREMGRVPIDPVLTRYDSTGTEEAHITGLDMEYDAEKGFATVRDSVKLAWHDVRGSCDLLTYYPDLQKAQMIGTPKVLRERDEAVGDTIWLYVTEGALDSAVIIGHAEALTPSDSTDAAPLSTLKGERIVMDFVDGKVDRMQSDGQAIGVYHIFEKGEDKGSNKVSGDRVTLLMGEDGLKDVIVVGDTEGKFLPPRLAKELRRGK